MIHIWEIRAPLGGVDPAVAVSTLTDSMDRLQHLHPALRGAAVQASEGVLVMRLRVRGRDRWAISAATRKIASRMLQRARVDVASASMVLLERLPSGRDVVRVESGQASADPI